MEAEIYGYGRLEVLGGVEAGKAGQALTSTLGLCAMTLPATSSMPSRSMSVTYYLLMLMLCHRMRTHCDS